MPSEPKEPLEQQNQAEKLSATHTALPKSDKKSGEKKRNNKNKQSKRKASRPAKAPKVPKTVDRLASHAGKTGLGSSLGQMFYLLGFYAECKLIQIWRVLRVILVFTGGFLGWLFGRLLRAVWAVLRSFLVDLLSPFHRLFVGLRNTLHVLREEKRKGEGHASKKALQYIKRGAKEYRHLLLNLLKYILPVAAAFVFVFTVHSMLMREYNLQVTVNGQTIGIISDESAFEDARTIVRQRIVAADDKGAESWLVTPQYALTGSSSITTKEQLVNNLLQSFSAADGDVLVDAIGFDVDGELFVTYEGDKVAAYLENLKVQYAVPGEEVDFLQQVSYDLDANDLFFSSSVQQADDIISQFGSVTSERVIHIADGEETIGEIAYNNNMSLVTILGYNTALLADETVQAADSDEEDLQLNANFVPDEGAEILIQPEEHFIQVYTSRIVYEQEEIPFETVYTDSYDYVKGREIVQVEGENGLQSVAYQVVTIDGVETKTLVEDIEPVIISQPVTQEILVGQYEYNYATATGNAVGSSAYIWPLPDYTNIGRGLSATHRGADINANAWSPIYAIAGGTVIAAEYHYSWGNYVLIDHGNGVTSRYAHCIELNVSVGDVVGQGDVVGFVGSTGNSSGNHLHLEIEVNGTLVDPYSYVSP